MSHLKNVQGCSAIDEQLKNHDTQNSFRACFGSP